MKTKEELKTELHKLIDSIEDEEILQVLNDDIIPAVIENHSKEFSDEEVHDSHEEHIIGIDQALSEIDTNDPLSPEEFKKMAEKWGTK